MLFLFMMLWLITAALPPETLPLRPGHAPYEPATSRATARKNTRTPNTWTSNNRGW